MPAGLVAVVWGAGVAAEEASAACDAFTADVDYISFHIPMPPGRRQVTLHVPIQFLLAPISEVEAADPVHGFFAVNLNSWKPVGRSQFATLSGVERDNVIFFGTNDEPPLITMVPQVSKSPDRDAQGNSTIAPDLPDGLTLLPQINIEKSGNLGADDMFISSLTHHDIIDGMIECGTAEQEDEYSAICNQHFKVGELSVGVVFSRTALHRWREIQSDVTAFLTCATRPTP